jgi:hypothetical protein
MNSVLMFCIVSAIICAGVILAIFKIGKIPMNEDDYISIVVFGSIPIFNILLIVFLTYIVLSEIQNAGRFMNRNF